jgi:hypothetical protein
MDNYVHQVHALLAEADSLPMSHTKLGLLEEAVRLADSHRDVPLGIQARHPLMFVARNLLRGDVLAVAFTWSLGHYDREPRLFAGRNLFWEYEMVIGQLANLDTIARGTLEEMLADFGRRLQESGASQGMALQTRRAIAADLGDRAMAAEADRALRRLRPPEPGSVRQQVECQMFLGNEDTALSLAEACLRDASRYSRDDAPTICCGALMPLLRRGQVDRVLRLLKHCLSYLKPEVCYYWHYGDIIKALALTGQTARAVGVYERCQRAIREFTDPLTRLHFALDAGVLFDRLAALGVPSVRMRLTDTVPVRPAAARYAVTELRDWLRREAADLAARFDRRNGTAYFAGQIQERADLQRWALPESDASPELS